ncbi:MAG: hypothetical protein JJE39_07445 [Vicinamibacteria bacterium]|nr:hypothetical protein [Vicinamibacteria bacterium]
MNSNLAIADLRAEARRIRRASWPVRRFLLGSEPDETLMATTTVEERIAMMWPLAMDAFSLGPGTDESAPRGAWPVTVRNLGDPEVD